MTARLPKAPDRPLSPSAAAGLVVLMVIQSVTLVVDLEMKPASELLRQISTSCGVVSLAITGYALVQTVRWLLDHA